MRDVPEEVHAALKARASEKRMSLSAFVLRELRLALSRPTTVGLLRQFEGRDDGARLSGDDIASLIREGRGER